jgi:hypothetical protein
MRLRFAVLAALFTALVGLAVPGTGIAAPKHNRGLTIKAIPNPILAGEAVLIYGQLYEQPVGGQTIVLYHHIAGIPGYSRVASTTTFANGFYEFPRAEDVVMTNRNWFVREEGVRHIHSRTIREYVSALVSLSASQSSQVTLKPVVFNGHVTPNHAFQRVYLQAQIGSSDDWRTLKSGLIGPGSNYSISYRFKIPGVYTVRAVFRGDFRNIRGESDPVSVTIEQSQVADFTINSSDPIIPDGHTVTITGVLDGAGGGAPEPGTTVTLFGRTVGGGPLQPLADTTTAQDGTYTFTQMPSSNMIYQVRTTFAPARHSAELFEGVEDVLTLTASQSQAMVGQAVTFQGTVLPDKAGDVVYLQRLGKDGDWHNTGEARIVRWNSTFQFSWTFDHAGTFVFRARIPGDPQNVGAGSNAVVVPVQLTPASPLPPAS